MAVVAHEPIFFSSTLNTLNKELKQDKEFYFTVPVELRGKRLDQFVADHEDFVHLTRSYIQNLIRAGNILVNGRKEKNGYRLHQDNQIKIVLPAPQPSSLVAEKLSFDILHEDDDVVVLSKPPGIVVHPSHGHSGGTLVHGLLHHCTNLSGVGGELRPGIVHRLDKDTSGIMIVAKNDASHQSLTAQFKKRLVEKRYLAILSGVPKEDEGRIELPIGRHSVHRKKMAVVKHRGRQALTYFHVLEKFDGYSFVRLRLETGRTHQIRVHMAFLACPVAGDALYGKNKSYPGFSIARQCLHSYSLAFLHPSTGKRMKFTAPLLPDMEDFLQILRNKES